MSILQAIDACRALLARGEPLCLVRVQASQGSVPRTRGAWMAVGAQAQAGTIGGGRLEFEAIAHARAWLAQPPADGDVCQRDYPLGPALGQCCGGRVQLAFEALTPDRLSALQHAALAALAPVALFGGGHVGHALARLLVTLPLRVDWVDSRDAVLESWVDSPPPANLRIEQSDPVQAAVADLAPGSQVLIMSYSHAEDFDITVACLERLRMRGDLPFIGLIGSRTKWATFSRRLRQRGFSDAEIAAVTCPIGIEGITGKEPEVIAVAVAAQLLRKLAEPVGA